MQKIIALRPVWVQKDTFQSAAIYVGALAIALFAGMAAALLPMTLMIGIISMPIIFFMAFNHPTYAFAAALFVMFGLLPPSVVSSLPLGGATVRPPELILMLLFTILGLRSIGNWKSIVSPARPLLFPLVLLTTGLVIGVLQGKVIHHYPQALAEARQYFGWLALPIALWLSKYKPEKLHKIVLTISLIAAIGMTFQLVTGIQVIYGFRGAEELSSEFRDITRSAIGGGSLFLCYSIYYLFGIYCNRNKNKPMLIIGILILLGGIAATFSRSVWAGVFIGGLFFLFVSPGLKSKKASSLALLLAIISISAMVLSLATPRVGEAIEKRIFSISEEGAKGSSIGFRFDENGQAIAAIQKSPILGIGLGGRYKQVFRQGSIGGGFDIEESFIHNAYLALWLKMGVFGFLFPIFLFISLIQITKKIAKMDHSSGDANIIRAYSAVGAIAMMYVESFTSPDWSQQGHIAAAAVLLVILLTVIQNRQTPTLVKKVVQ